MNTKKIMFAVAAVASITTMSFAGELLGVHGMNGQGRGMGRNV